MRGTLRGLSVFDSVFNVSAPEYLLRTSIIVLPLLVLLVLFFLLYSGSRRRQHDDSAGQVESNNERGHGEPLSRMGMPGAEAAAIVATCPVEAPVETIVVLEERLAGAEEAGEPVALAHIYLALGRARVAAGDENGALAALRSSAGLAALHKIGRVHAEARLELADAAFRAGDLTSACEHWQMARMAFLDERMAAEGDKVDSLMRSNGCPTDWVLTDF
jgi:hypothetical protein